jgi:hypothetical protein
MVSLRSGCMRPKRIQSCCVPLYRTPLFLFLLTIIIFLVFFHFIYPLSIFFRVIF